MAKLYLEAKVAETADEALCGFLWVPSIEVGRPEIRVGKAPLEHEVGCGEHRSSDRDNGLLGTAAALEAEVLGTQCGVFLAGGGPSGLDESRFEPSIAWAQPIGAPLASALIAART